MTEKDTKKEQKVPKDVTRSPKKIKKSYVRGIDRPRIPKAACNNMMRNKTGFRIGDTATSYMAIILEELCENVAKEAAYLAKHAGRKTIKREDVESAYERVKSRL